MIESFPPVKLADRRTGLIAIGGDLEVSSLVLAYRSGIFPWPLPDEPLAWFAPAKRALLFFKNYKPSKSFLRFARSTTLRCTVDQAFERVIRLCAESHSKGPDGGTWITEQMILAYCQLHRAGFAHSVEVWNGKLLVGGIYGIALGKMFAAESMFHLESNASKLALNHLIELLKKRKIEWIDTQVINPFTKSLGCTEVSRDQFMKLLNAAIGSAGFGNAP